MMDVTGQAPSYRQTGKAPFKGTLMRGKLTGQAQSGKNFSTIPSKFETTLFTGNKEKDGFGSRAHRFVDTENDLPGPGTYNDHEQKINDDKIYSKKGLGVGFVSKVKRGDNFKATSAAPGPGNYERGGDFMHHVRETNRANRSGSTATFKPPTERSVMVAPDPIPGPADYRVYRDLDSDAPRQLQDQLQDSVFRSQTMRGKGVGKGAAGGPAPGSYNPQKPGQLLGGGDAALLPSAAFRSGVPIAGRGPERLTREQQLGVVAAPTAMQPGPGEYDPPTSSLKQDFVFRRSPQFCDSSHDRFGKPVKGAAPSQQLLTPGPGAYLQDQVAETAVISSSVFMSGTTRGAKGGRSVVPGPAYYSPAPDGKKSFHLNARQRWVPTI